METRNIELSGLETEGLPLNSIRWTAIFAGLAVYGSGARPDGSSISLAAGLWNKP